MVKKYGLKILHPKLSLLFIIISTSLFAFINSLDIAVGAFLTSIVILLLGRKLVFQKIFFYILIINTIYLVLGNWLFSPSGSDNTIFFIFQINNIGLYNGIVGALKRNAMIILSFAWLSSVDSLYNVFNAINFSSRFSKIIIVFLKWIQNLKHDFVLLYYSIYLRGFNLSTKNPRVKLIQLIIILKAILNKFFANIGKMTFNGESHFNYSDSINEYTGKIEIKNLFVYYDEKKDMIIKGVNLTISEGEVVFVAGNNGSGKTTLLKAISGYIPKIEGYISSGDVTISNKSLNSNIQLKEINKILRYIVENPADSIIGLNVKQELLAQTSDKTLINYYSELLDIRHLWERDSNTLSGGEQARVVLASLLCSNVKILVLESPLGQLDPWGRKSFISALKKIIESKSITVIISDQYADYYDGIIDRFILLDDGQIKYDKSSNNGQINEFLDTLNLRYPILEALNQPTYSKEIVVSMRDISIAFENKKVLSNINLEFYKNQCIAIMGDNGSGKSTLMLVLSKVLNPDFGDLQIFGNKVGMIFQDCSKQVLEDNIKDEILLALKNSSPNRDTQEKFANQMINWSQLQANQSTLDISASQIRLLEISSNIYNKEIIIFDEPTNYLDNGNIIKLHSFIQNLLKIGKTIFIVTHDNQLASLCNRFILLHKSKIVLDTDNFEELLLTRKSISNV